MHAWKGMLQRKGVASPGLWKFKLIGSEIVDKTDGRVDVIFASQGVRLHETFFRDAESCQRFNNELVRAQEQERQREQDKLSKYR
jgi:hypothetical protein